MWDYIQGSIRLQFYTTTQKFADLKLLEGSSEKDQIQLDNTISPLHCYKARCYYLEYYHYYRTENSNGIDVSYYRIIKSLKIQHLIKM